eukprot:3487679-Rhodomonas_salina.2
MARYQSTGQYHGTEKQGCGTEKWTTTVPGTGKTLLAKTVCSALGVEMLCVDAPELVGGYYGDCERKVRELFDRARRLAPTVVFFDEIDVISARRDKASGEMERRLVSALVQELDNLQGARGRTLSSEAAPSLGATERGHRVVVIGYCPTLVLCGVRY